MVDKLQKT
jgi:hypothetical protein